jgi:hypothetical protein
MVHVSSHSLQRHKVVTVIVLASVSIRLPWQNGQAVGRLIASLNRDSDIVGVLHLAFIKVFALFTNAHESGPPRPWRRRAAVIADSEFTSEQPDATPLFQHE